MINRKNKILAMTLSTILATGVFSSVSVKAVEAPKDQANPVKLTDTKLPEDKTEVTEPVKPTDDELYLSAYTVTADAMTAKTQKSINIARKEIKNLPENLNWAKAEFSKQLDIVQDNLMSSAIKSYYTALESELTIYIDNTNKILDDIKNSEDPLIVAWANSLKAQLKPVAYNKAVKEARNKIYSLPNVANSLKEKSSIKIAFWGDSITEGADNVPADTYPQLLIEDLKKIMPGVKIEYTNFALGGRQTYNANDEGYKAADEEHYWSWAGGFIDFHRDWSVTDKSWKQHIVDYKPDLLLVAFGMNDATNNMSDYGYIKNIDSMVSYVKENSPKTDITLVSTMMPTENKELYTQNTEFTLQIARATREYAKLNNLPLIDTNRLWNILLSGRDEDKFVTEKFTDIKDIENKTAYNLDLQVELKDLEIPSQPTDVVQGTDIKVPEKTQATEIAVRSDIKNGGIVFKFDKAEGETYINIYSMDNGMNKEGIKIGTVKANDINTIRLDGAILIVNGQTFVLYKHLREGLITFPAGKENIKSIKLSNNKFFTQEALSTELDMLGEVYNNNASGNGINHPTAKGTKLSYYEACQSIVNSIKAEYEKIAAGK